MAHSSAQRVDKPIDTLADAEKGSEYFVKLFSSAYGGTVENNFAKSKQCQEKFDIFLGIFYGCFWTVYDTCPYTALWLNINVLALDRLFRQSEAPQGDPCGAFHTIIICKSLLSFFA